MGGSARTYVERTPHRGPRILAASATLALATGLAVLPVGALSVPGPPVKPALLEPAVPKPALSKIALPKVTPPKPAPPKITPPLPGLVPIGPSVVGTVASAIAAPLDVIGPTIAPLLAPTGVVPAVATAVAPLAPLARPLAPAIAVRTPRELVATLEPRSSKSAARSGQAADRLSATSASGSTVRLTGGGEVRIVPRSVCSTQVASAQPVSPALCTSVTAEEAAALGLSPSPEPSPFGWVAGLAVTGGSIAVLAIIGVLSLGLGGLAHPFRGARARRLAALA